MEIDHIAIVVKDLEAAIRLYTRVLGFKEVFREVVYDQGVETVGLEAGESFIELLLTARRRLADRALIAARPRRGFITRPIASTISRRSLPSSRRQALRSSTNGRGGVRTAA